MSRDVVVEAASRMIVRVRGGKVLGLDLDAPLRLLLGTGSRLGLG